MAFETPERPANQDTLGLLGYLIVANKQIHSFQLEILDEYLSSIELTVPDTILAKILDGQEDAITYQASLEAYKAEDFRIQRDIYYRLIVLASVDDSIDENEEKIIDNALEASGIDPSDAEMIRQAAEENALEIRKTKNTLSIWHPGDTDDIDNWLLIIIRWFILLFQKLFGIEDSEASDMAQTAYKQAIEKCANVAKEDFAVLYPAYIQIINNCKNVLFEIENYKKLIPMESVYSKEVSKVLESLLDILNNDVLRQCEKAQLSLDQKKRTVSDFTVSLLGRTKAGKSTLHAILTNQGRDKIGEGRQRTTRYNRVYQWNLLRLIDTPGIGSAEAAGRTDDQIAESVLGESDIICFVVVDDSILRDVLEFIEKIAKLNKPIIILLNHKENIRPEVKYKRFLSNPREWIDTEGESNLAGHINRIQKYADENNFGNLVKVYPVFLLPALMAADDEYSNDRDLLWESSNIGLFIDQLTNWIITCGTIKRSQTILDEAIQVLGRSIKSISGAEILLATQKEKLNKDKDDKIASLKKTEREVYKRIEESLFERFYILARRDALDFAVEAYKDKNDINGKWQQYLKRIGFEEDIREVINQEIQQYNAKVEEVVTALFEELYYSFIISINSKEIEIPIQFDFRNAAKIIGGIVGTIGFLVSGPLGIAVMGIGTALALSSFLFESKEKRRQKAIDKVYDSVKKTITDKTAVTIAKILQDVQNALEDNTKQVEMMFWNLEQGLDRAMSLSEKLRNEYLFQKDNLNRRYAYRIVQYIENRSDGDEKISPDDILSVDRSKTDSIVITTRKNINPVSGYSLEGIIAEKVYIKWGT